MEDLVFEGLYQARFADSGFTAQQDDLPISLFDLCSVSLE